MIRYFSWWLVLSIGLVTATLATSTLVYRHLDLRFVYLVHLVVIPGVQALVLTLATRRASARSLTAAAGSLWADPLARVLLLIDVPLVALGWIARGHPTLGFDGGASLQPTWIGTKTFVAGGLLLWIARRPTAPRRADRLAMVALGVILMAFGLQPFRPWLSDLSFAVLGTQSMLVRLLATYGTVFWVGMAITLATARGIRGRHPLAAGAIEAATAPAFVGALIVGLNGYLRGLAILEPWPSLALTCATLSATCLLAGAALGTTAAANRGRES